MNDHVDRRRRFPFREVTRPEYEVHTRMTFRWPVPVYIFPELWEVYGTGFRYFVVLEWSGSCRVRTDKLARDNDDRVLCYSFDLDPGEEPPVLVVFRSLRDKLQFLEHVGEKSVLDNEPLVSVEER